MKPEAKVLAAIVKELKRRQASGEPIWWLKVHGGPLQRAGVPDLHVTYYGQSLWLEVKAPGGEATVLQSDTMKRIRDAGGVSRVVSDVHHVADLLHRVSVELKRNSDPS
ncbi:MAG: hypothetical protein KGL39_35565 [Patescibacteria group bacterium]|nr:hypothetical protein [Patescibacteria group bacterium]